MPVVRAISGSTTQVGYILTLISPVGTNYTAATITGDGVFDAGFGTWAIGTPHVLKIVASNTGSTVTLQGYVDGVLAVTTTDTSATAWLTGNPGFEVDGDEVQVNDTMVTAWQDH